MHVPICFAVFHTYMFVIIFMLSKNKNGIHCSSDGIHILCTPGALKPMEPSLCKSRPAAMVPSLIILQEILLYYQYYPWLRVWSCQFPLPAYSFNRFCILESKRQSVKAESKAGYRLLDYCKH